MAARAVTIALVLAALLTPQAFAQQLPRLAVRSFALTTDSLRPAVGSPFTVTLAVRLAEPASELETLSLPSFSGFEELGEERSMTTLHGQSFYRQTFRLVALVRETRTIGPAYFDAIDARDGKPKRFLSNVLTLRVRGGTTRDPWDAGRRAAAVILALALAGCGAAVVRVLRRSNRGKIAIPAADAIAAAPASDPVASALRLLEVRRDRPAVSFLRAVLWERLGAREGETLSDVLDRTPVAPSSLHATLVLVERAAFIGERNLAGAIADVLAHIERDA